MPCSSLSLQLPCLGSDLSDRSENNSRWYDTDTDSCYYPALLFARPCVHLCCQRASGMIAAEPRGQDMFRCSTSKKGRKWSSRRKECIRRVRQASCVRQEIGGFQGPIDGISATFKDQVKRNDTGKYKNKCVMNSERTSSDLVSRCRYGLMDLYCL